MARVEKITENLKWESLAQAYFIGFRMEVDLKRDAHNHIVLDDNNHPIPVKHGRMVNELQEAIDHGDLDLMVQEAADLLHGGDVSGVYQALARNLDSKRYHLKRVANKESSVYKHDLVMFETLEKFVNAHKQTKEKASNGDLPQWAYGPAQIDKIEDTDKLQKVINSISDVCCNKAGAAVYSQRLGEDYIEEAKANREYARKRKAELEATAHLKEIDPDLLKKLSGGKKIQLSPEQATALFKILGGK